jgi:two-component system sensor histidine kinase KdpD
MIRRARRMADYLDADCFAVFIEPGGLDRLGGERRAEIDQVLNFARNLHIETRVLEGSDIARTLLDFARVHHVAQILMARPRYTPWDWFPGRNPVHRIVRQAPDMEIILVGTA